MLKIYEVAISTGSAIGPGVSSIIVLASSPEEAIVLVSDDANPSEITGVYARVCDLTKACVVSKFYSYE